MVAHTPGTWISMDGTGTFGEGIIALTDDDHLSPPIALPPDPPDGENWTADSHLIAAAPDLLAVGNEMYALLHDAANGVKDLGMALVLAKVCDRWDAAIKKANGGA